MNSELSFSFTPTPDDRVRPLRAYVFRQPMTWIVIFLTGSMALGGGLGVLSAGLQRYPWGLFFVLAFIGYLVFLTSIYPKLLKRKIQQQPDADAQVEWVIGDEAVVIRKNDRSVAIEWDSFEKVLVTREDYIFVRRGQSRQLLSFPRRALGDSVARGALDGILSRHFASLKE